MAFRGTFDHTLDAKNRLTIPAKFRASLAEGVVLSKGIERCVQVWTPRAYDAYVAAKKRFSFRAGSDNGFMPASAAATYAS